MRIFITGATGFIGTDLVKELLAAGTMFAASRAAKQARSSCRLPVPSHIAAPCRILTASVAEPKAWTSS